MKGRNLSKQCIWSLGLLSVSLGLVAGCGEAEPEAGADGTSALVETSAVGSGEECEFGGLEVRVGLDADGDGVLGDSEITSRSYVCNGVDGSDGADGSDGSDGAAGSDGVDGSDGADGVDGEDGADGADGRDSLLETSDLPVGGECEFGGTLIEVGLDEDGDGVLDDEEITQTSTICESGTSECAASGPLSVVSITDDLPDGPVYEGESYQFTVELNRTVQGSADLMIVGKFKDDMTWALGADESSVEIEWTATREALTELDAFVEAMAFDHQFYFTDGCALTLGEFGVPVPDYVTNDPDPGPQVAITQEPTPIYDVGDQTQICWEGLGVDTCQLLSYGEELATDLAPTGCLDFTTDETRRLTMECSHDTGVISQDTFVTVGGTLQFGIDQILPAGGGDVTVQWESAGMQSCEVEVGGAVVSTDLTGTYVASITETTAASVSCVDNFGVEQVNNFNLVVEAGIFFVDALQDTRDVLSERGLLLAWGAFGVEFCDLDVTNNIGESFVESDVVINEVGQLFWTEGSLPISYEAPFTANLTCVTADDLFEVEVEAKDLNLL